MTTIERYASAVGGTAKKARFKNAARIDKRDENKIDDGEKMRVYLDSISAAATASNKQMQEMTVANKAKDDQVTTLLAALVVKD